MPKSLNIDIKAEGNTLTFSHHQITIFDPTGSHGAENALKALINFNMPISCSTKIINSVKKLCQNTRGQFQVMNHTKI